MNENIGERTAEAAEKYLARMYKSPLHTIVGLAVATIAAILLVLWGLLSLTTLVDQLARTHRDWRVVAATIVLELNLVVTS